jgi:6-phosphofructokinase 1
MNACIRSVIRACAHYNLEVYGIHRGYQGLIENEIHPMTTSSVANIIQMGGTILKTARSMDFMTPEGRKKAHQNLVNLGIEGIVCIGGNGTYTGAMIFEKEFGIPSMGCPGTIDNDLWGTDATIGYDTAINTAMEAIDKIRDTADAHNRIFFVEVMGRHSGHIALLSGIAGGAEGIFIPERGNEFDDIVQLYESKARKKEFSIFVVAEGDEEGRDAAGFGQRRHLQ